MGFVEAVLDVILATAAATVSKYDDTAKTTSEVRQKKKRQNFKPVPPQPGNNIILILICSPWPRP